MKITIRCGKCGKSYSVDENLVGKCVRCKACNEVFKIVSQQKNPIKTAVAIAGKIGKAPRSLVTRQPVYDESIQLTLGANAVHIHSTDAEIDTRITRDRIRPFPPTCTYCFRDGLTLRIIQLDSVAEKVFLRWLGLDFWQRVLKKQLAFYSVLHVLVLVANGLVCLFAAAIAEKAIVRTTFGFQSEWTTEALSNVFTGVICMTLALLVCIFHKRITMLFVSASFFALMYLGSTVYVIGMIITYPQMTTLWIFGWLIGTAWAFVLIFGPFAVTSLERRVRERTGGRE